MNSCGGSTLPEPASPCIPWTTHRPHRPVQKARFVKKQLQEIRQEQAEKKAEKSKQQERQHPTPGHAKQKKKQKGR